VRRVSLSSVIVLAATLVGALLRLWNLEAAQFRGDDFTVMALAIDIARHWQLPTGVPSSIGINNGPTAPFILAAAALVSDEHQWLSVFIGLLNIAMIPLTYVLARDVFGARAGVLAAVLVAVNPWLIVYGRRLWLNAFLGPTALVFLWTLYRALSRGGWAAWTLSGFAAAVSAQIHLSAIPNLLALGSAFPFARRIRVAPALTGLAVAALFLVPWIVLSFIPDVSHFQPSTPATATADSGISSIERATISVTGVAYQVVAGQGGQILDATGMPFVLVDTLARGLAAAGLLHLTFLVWQLRGRRPAVAAFCLGLLIMVVVPTLALLRPAQAGQLPFLYPYYFINLIPPLLIGMAALCAAASGGLRHVGAVLIGIICVSQLALAVPFFRTHEEFWPLGGYGVPWRFTRELVDTTRAMAAADGSGIMAGGEDVEDSEQASVTARLLKRSYEPVRLFDSRDGLVYRSGEAVIS
jgi:4-amino-4-deoxy-L-arabinose transferase-like glycosyltransferase